MNGAFQESMKIAAKSNASRLSIDVAKGVITCDQWVPRSLSDTFRFFSDAQNLEIITPPFLNFKIERMSTAFIEEGTEIDYRLSLRGLPIRWRSRILGWEPPHRFSDLQLMGPYRYWNHRHVFEAENNGTWIRDRVDFALPAHFLSHRWMGGYVKADLENIFWYRQRAVQDLLKGKL